MGTTRGMLVSLTWATDIVGKDNFNVCLVSSPFVSSSFIMFISVKFPSSSSTQHTYKVSSLAQHFKTSDFGKEPVAPEPALKLHGERLKLRGTR